MAHRYTERSVYHRLVILAASRNIPVLIPAKYAKDFVGYSLKIRRVIITDLGEAWKAGALCLNRPFYGNGRHGYRVARFTKGESAESDLSRIFLTATEAIDAIGFALAFTEAKR